MNPELPRNPRAELEAKVTALLLGELSAEEAAGVREMIAKDAELGRLRDRLSATLELVRETAATPAGETPAQPAPLKLSAERREKLLAQFKTIAPKEFARPSRRKISWLVPLAAAAAVALMVTLFLPRLAGSKQASYRASVINNLRLLDSAKQQWALEQRKASTDVPKMGDLIAYFGRGASAEIPGGPGERYFLGPVGHAPVALVDVGGSRKFITLPGAESELNPAALNKPVPVTALSQQAGGGGLSKVAPMSPAAAPSQSRIVLPESGQPQVAQANNQQNAGRNQGITVQGGVAMSDVGGVVLPAEKSKAPATPAVEQAEHGPAFITGTYNYAEKDQSAAGNSSAPAAKKESMNMAFATELPAGAARESLSRPSSGDFGGFRRGRTPAAPAASTPANRSMNGAGNTFPTGAVPPPASASAEPVQQLANADKSVDILNSSQIATAGKVQQAAAANGRDGQRVFPVEEAASVLPAGQPQTAAPVLAAAPSRVENDAPLSRRALPAPAPQAEVETRDNPFTTFSLNVSDVAFKLAAASLQNGAMPDAASMRSEEFINAFDYRDPEPAPGAPIGFAWERAADPFAQNRDLLRFSIKTSAQGREAGRRLNLVLLLDKSGSMERADRVEIVLQALQVLAAQLRAQDTLSVVVFARTARLWVDGVAGSQAGAVAGDLRGLTPEGGTNLEEAMRLAYETALRHYLADGENRVVLLTDGAANLGNVEPDALKQNVETNRKQGISFDCFGVGWDGYNDDLLETLSRAGNGRYAFINTPEEAATEFAGKLAGALRVAAADVKVQVEFNSNRVTSFRQIGYAKYQLATEQFRDNSVTAAQIGAAESGNALYTVEINPAGDGPLGTVHVRFRVPGTSDYQEHEWTLPYTGNAPPLEKSSAAMRLTATAAAFSEWLAGSPYAGEVTPDRLLGYLSGVPQAYGADARPAKLEWMIRQAKSISGK